ncbi:MAG: hypothetical protein VZR24_18935 [Butyrivibrio hungatei]|nr:hypothetical protein [Butyrivibrio hungatei]
MTIYPIVRGIYLVSHEIEGFIMPFEKNNSGIPLYTINYCLSGRCEFRKTDDKVSYLSPGVVCIGYTNQGRFAKVFRDHYRMKPLKYRHSV